MPAVDVAALRKQIAAGRLAPVYLLVGEDIRLIEDTVDAIEATVEPADRPFAVERAYAGEAGGTPLDIAAAARVFPMLGDRRIVIVLRAERLLKPKRASKAAEVEETDEERAGEEPAADFGPLEDYLQAPVPSTTLVFVATEIDRGRRFTKRLIERAQVAEFAGLEGAGAAAGRRDARGAAVELVQAAVAQAGRTIDRAALQLVVDRAGDDVTKLRGDLERLLLYTEGQKRIGHDDVAEVVSSERGGGDDWAVVNAIAEGDAARALRAVADRLDAGVSPHALVGQLRWWVANRLAEADPERARPAIEALLRTDLALKSSGGDERVLVERLVVELVGRPVARRW